MTVPDLSKLTSVNLREAWAHEAQHFTPWLADNLDRLSDGLGIDLELEGTEVQVGPFFADIVAQHGDSRVLIENQLEDANLQHLGQVLAYLAGLEAQIVVWVAKEFAEPHISAIRWLNEHTVDPFAFFAVRVRVVRIGNSPLAPVFDVVERPNEWDRQVQQISRQGELSATGRFRRDFWAYVAQRRPHAPRLRPGYASSNVWHSVDEAGLWVVQFLAYDRVGVYLIGRGKEEARAEFQARIDPFRGALRDALDDSNLRDGKEHWCISEFRVDSHDRSNWDQMVDWLEERRQTYEQVLRSSPASTD